MGNRWGNSGNNDWLRCFWTVVLEKTLESPLNCKEIQPVHPKGDQSWVLFGRTGVEAETPILWPTDAKSWLIWKDPDAGKDWGQEEKGTTENEMVWWQTRLNGHGFGSRSWWWTGRSGAAIHGVAKIQTERLNWTELNWTSLYPALSQRLCFPWVWVEGVGHNSILWEKSSLTSFQFREATRDWVTPSL